MNELATRDVCDVFQKMLMAISGPHRGHESFDDTNRINVYMCCASNDTTMNILI